MALRIIFANSDAMNYLEVHGMTEMCMMISEHIDGILLQSFAAAIIPVERMKSQISAPLF